jgi:hypothetical protein
MPHPEPFRNDAPARLWQDAPMPCRIYLPPRQACALFALALALTACGPRTPPPDPDRDRELNRFREAVQTVQERYIDADTVPLDLLISNSLRGVIEQLDPHAVIIRTGTAAPAAPPPDAPAVEYIPPGPDGIAVLRIFRFAHDTATALRDAAPAAAAPPPLGLLLDARAAAGQHYEAAAAVAEWLLPRGSVVGALVDGPGAPPRPITTRAPPRWFADLPVIALIDNQTAGPAEWLAAALQHHHRALLVGTPTRGLTQVRQPVVLDEHWTVLLSTGRALDPNGQPVTGAPLLPDIPVSPPTENDENIDWIGQRGIQVLSERLPPAPP